MTFESLPKKITLALLDRGLVQVQGLDAEKFLQGQLTCDVRLATEHAPPCLSAHCNLKGRVIFTCRLFYSDGGYFLAMPKSQVETAISSLKKYAAFSKVAICDASKAIKNPLQDQETDDSDACKRADIASGIADIYPETSGQFTPHELNYHELNGVSFEKGCYIGQEIVARMHYRGKLKNRFMHARVHLTKPPQRGEKIFYREHEQDEIAGYMVDFAKEGVDNYHLLVSLSTKATDCRLWVEDKSGEKVCEQVSVELSS